MSPLIRAKVEGLKLKSMAANEGDSTNSRTKDQSINHLIRYQLKKD